jgi:hypothetical protein
MYRDSAGRTRRRSQIPDLRVTNRPPSWSSLSIQSQAFDINWTPEKNCAEVRDASSPTDGRATTTASTAPVRGSLSLVLGRISHPFSDRKRRAREYAKDNLRIVGSQLIEGVTAEDTYNNHLGGRFFEQRQEIVVTVRALVLRQLGVTDKTVDLATAIPREVN